MIGMMGIDHSDGLIIVVINGYDTIRHLTIEGSKVIHDITNH